MKSGCSFFLKLSLTCVSSRIFHTFRFWKHYSQLLHLKFCSDKLGTKGNTVAVAVLVAVDDSTKAEFEEHAAVTESVVVQTNIENGSLIAEAPALL